ncbi:MAG: hypothetical protein COT84_06975 [Chlamydiae bacterium CG10_big_fil_rev_8_21_14_0_10_35_9]|nr:MAG: hypothetical protein COT84_06975 [Chlamydiae bacterium CG10_big_fil_rev_8_21_14_0_10_35_9]
MAAQIQPRTQVPIPGVSLDSVEHQWIIGDNSRVVTLYRNENDLRICHVFNVVTQQATRRLLEELAYLTDSTTHTWENWTPEVVDTLKGPMCVFRRLNEECWSKITIKDRQSFAFAWVFYGFKERKLPRGKNFINYFHYAILSANTNRVCRRVCRNEIREFTTKKHLPLLNDQDQGAKDFFYAMLLSSRVIANFLPPYLPDKFNNFLTERFLDAFYISNPATLLDVQYNASGVPIASRRPIELEMDLSVINELEGLDPLPEPRWHVEDKIITLVQRNHEIKYRIQDADTGRKLSQGVYKNLFNNEIQRIQYVFEQYADSDNFTFFNLLGNFNRPNSDEAEVMCDLFRARIIEEEAHRVIKSRLSRCVYLEDDGVPNFNANIIHRWSLENNKELRLIVEKDHLWWWVFDKRTKKSIRSNIEITGQVTSPIFNKNINFARGIEYSSTDKCSESTRCFIRSLADLPIEEQLRSLKDFNLKKVKVFNSRGAKFISVALEPSIVKRSKIDDRVRITKFMWAVTLTRIGAEELDDEGNVIVSLEQMRKMKLPRKHQYGQHAQIFIEGIAPDDNFFEGIRKNQQFCIMCDFNGSSNGLCTPGPSFVAIRNLSDAEIRYVERSQTWKRSSKKVIKMLGRMMEESRGEVPLPEFFKPGRDSVGAKDNMDSCITWSREKFELIDIHLSRAYVGVNTHTATSYYTYPQEFHEQNIPEGHNLL